MQGAVKIATAFNIPIKIHWSFLAIFGFLGYLAWENQLDVEGTFWLGMLFFSLFVCVILHEYGHALMARKYGIPTVDITLTPIGGIARLTSLPENPWQELWVALAGPAVNVVIALVLFPILYFSNSFSSDVMADEGLVIGWQTLLPALLMVNITLAIFNLLPAFPMDGGRVLRALLSTRLPRLKATLIATRIGQVLGLLFLGWGLWNGAYSLALIGVFVLVTAQREYRSLWLDDMLNHQTIEKLVDKHISTLLSNEDITVAVKKSQSLPLHQGAVVLNPVDFSVEGMLFYKDLPKGEITEGTCVHAYPIFDTPHLGLQDTMGKVFRLFRYTGFPSLPVVDKAEVVGIVTQENLLKHLKM